MYYASLHLTPKEFPSSVLSPDVVTSKSRSDTSHMLGLWTRLCALHLEPGCLVWDPPDSAYASCVTSVSPSVKWGQL
jgi:hypothetical protein